MCERLVSIRVSPPVKPAPLYEAATIFAATSLLFFACLYLLLPLLRLHHISWFTTYNLVLAAPMFMLVGCAFFGYHLEGRKLRWPDVCDRFRLRRMSLDTWLWTAALTIFMFGGRYASLAAFILVLLALGLDRSAGLKRRMKMAFGVAAFLALTSGIWQAQPVALIAIWRRSFNDICRISLGYSTLPDHQAVACRLNNLRRDDVKLVHF
jgi:hypothetical protein